MLSCIFFPKVWIGNNKNDEENENKKMFYQI